MNSFSPSLAVIVAGLLSVTAMLVASLAWIRRTLRLYREHIAWLAEQIDEIGRRELPALLSSEKLTDLEGEIDRLRDSFEMHVGNYRKFRARVTMREKRESEESPDDAGNSGKTVEQLRQELALGVGQFANLRRGGK